MRDTVIETKEGYLGPYHVENDPRFVQVRDTQTLVYESDLDATQVGDTQTMVYKSDLDATNGPYELDDNDKESRRLDHWEDLPPAKHAEKNKLKRELVDDLLSSPLGLAEGRNKLEKKTVRTLQQLCKSQGISTKKKVTQKLVSGWWGKVKGLLQVLRERGWINEQLLHKYKIVARDEDGCVIPEFSLLHLLENCTDFKNETSQLEYLCEALGVRAVITTKYHAEYAGEGVEYSWGLSKLHYRRYPLESKQTADKFRSLVRCCISRDVLTTEVIGRFSKRARQYMVGYRILMKDQESGDLKCDISYCRIEHMKSILKCHRAALDFDKGFIMTELTDVEFNIEEDLEKKVKKESGVVIPLVKKEKSIKKSRDAPQTSPGRQQQKKKGSWQINK